MFKLDGDICDGPVDEMVVEIEGDGGDGEGVWVGERCFIGCEEGLGLMLLLNRRRGWRGLGSGKFRFGVWFGRGVDRSGRRWGG